MLSQKNFITATLLATATLVWPAHASTPTEEAPTTTPPPALEPTGLRSESSPYLGERFNLELGLFFPSINTEARLDSKVLGRGTEVDLEDDFDLEDNEALMSASASARITEKFSIFGSYVDLSRSTSTTLQRDIQWGDEEYNIGARINAYFDIQIARIAFGYSIIKTPRWEAGLTLGTHIAWAGTGVKVIGEGDLSGGAVSREADTDATLPLPNFGAYGGYQLTKNLSFVAHVDYFTLEYEDYEGSLVELSTGLRYRLFEYLTLGVNYTYFNVEAGLDNDKWSGRFEFGYNGPQVILGSTF